MMELKYLTNNLFDQGRESEILTYFLQHQKLYPTKQCGDVIKLGLIQMICMKSSWQISKLEQVYQMK